jgi:hypothetical protein
VLKVAVNVTREARGLRVVCDGGPELKRSDGEGEGVAFAINTK